MLWVLWRTRRDRSSRKARNAKVGDWPPHVWPCLGNLARVRWRVRCGGEMRQAAALCAGGNRRSHHSLLTPVTCSTLGRRSERLRNGNYCLLLGLLLLRHHGAAANAVPAPALLDANQCCCLFPSHCPRLCCFPEVSVFTGIALFSRV